MKTFGIFNELDGFRLLRFSTFQQESREYEISDRNGTVTPVKEICIPDIDADASNLGRQYNPTSQTFISNARIEALTAEEWLAVQGYSSIRLVTLLDLEHQIAAASKSSPKLTSVRAWINGILAAFVQDPTPKSDWPPAPFTFEETTQEAFGTLTQ